MTPSEQLRLPIRWSVLGAVIAVMVVILVAAGWVNQRRRASQLEAIQGTDCAVAYPAHVVEVLETLHSEQPLTSEDARAVAKAVQALYRKGRRVEILYERDGKHWTVSSWNGPRAAGERELASAESCEGKVGDEYFVVERTVMLDSQRRVVVSTYQAMGT